MESRLNEQIEENILSKSELGESVADNIITDVCEDVIRLRKEKGKYSP